MSHLPLRHLQLLVAGCTSAALGMSLLTPLEASALNFRSVTLTGVANVTQLTMTPDPGDATVSDGLLGFGGGLLTELNLSNNTIGIETGALYVQRKYGDASTEITETRLQVPLLLRLWFGGFSVGGGAYMANSLGDLQTGLESVDLGWTAAAGYDIKFGSSSTGLMVEGRYSQSLFNAASAANLDASYTDLQVLTGIRFEFGGGGSFSY